MAQTTKKALAASLKKFLLTKPLNKITINDITKDCEINRMTFYYHFKDIYDLVEWIFIEEASVVLEGKKTYDTWMQGMLNIYEWVLENKPLIVNVYHSANRETLERYLYKVTYDLIYGVVEEKASNIPVSEEDKVFIADFYKYAFVGEMMNWIKDGMKEEPQWIVKRLAGLIHGSMEQAFQYYCKDRYTLK